MWPLKRDQGTHPLVFHSYSLQKLHVISNEKQQQLTITNRTAGCVCREVDQGSVLDLLQYKSS